MELSIIYLSPDTLKEYENNARVHGDDDIQAIVESIKAFGFNDPIAVWGKDNLIIEGHGRLQAAKRLGLRKVPCFRLDYLTDEERKAYALAHNKTAELSEWDLGILEIELLNIPEIDMSLFGFAESKTQMIVSGTEIDIDDFEDDKFEKVCPKCGFRFNP